MKALKDNVRSVGMKKICKKLSEKHGIDISSLTALDFYARKGDWQTAVYADVVRDIEAWEVDPEHEEQLIKNLPAHANIRIGNSFTIAREERYKNKFDFIVLDNPAGCYGKGLYCEHFESLELVKKLMTRDFGVVVFNIKTNPFDFDKFPEWKKRRQQYYGLEDTSNLSLEFIENFYRNKLEIIGKRVKFLFIEHRPQQNDLYAVVVGLEEKD